VASTFRIPTDQLAWYFDGLTKRFLRDATADAITVDLISPTVGDQVEMQGVGLKGITFDPRTNALEFALDDGTHRVYEPREVWIEEAPDDFPRSIQIVRHDGTREVAVLRRPGIEREAHGPRRVRK
jgi:Family of unknown function (DUF5335)